MFKTDQNYSENFLYFLKLFYNQNVFPYQKNVSVNEKNEP